MYGKQEEARIRRATKHIKTIRMSIAEGQSKKIHVREDLSSVSDGALADEYITRRIRNTPLDYDDRPF